MSLTDDSQGEGLSFSILLGGTPTPTPERWGTALLVEAGDTTVMLDAGPGVTRRLVESGAAPTDVDAVVFTHHHFDHNAGFPGLFLSRWDQGAGRFEELKIYGPPETRRFVDRLFAPDEGAFWPDLNARMKAPPSHSVYKNRGGVMPRLGPEPIVREINPAEAFSVGDIEITSGLARHVQPYLDSNAYRVTVGSSSVVYTGDTEPCDEVIDLASGCDVLVSMCWDEEHTMIAGGENNGQTGTLGAARMAQASGAGALVLTHVGPSISEGLHPAEEAAMAEIYDGPVYLSGELWKFDVANDAVEVRRG